MPTIAELFDLATRHHQDGDLRQAEQLYRQVLQHDPSNPEVRTKLGLILQVTGRTDEALACFTEAVRLNPFEAHTHNNLGAALAGHGQLTEALACYRQALRLNPNHVEAHNNLGTALKDLGQPAEALASYRHALRLNPGHAGAHNNLGNLFQEAGQLDEAVRSYRQALHFNPNHAEAHYNLGNALKNQGLLAEAIASYRHTLQLNPHHAGAHNNLGNAFKEQGQLTEALHCYQQALRLNPKNALTHNSLGNALKDLGQVEAAIVCYRKAVELDPGLVDAHSNLILALHYCPGVDAATLLKECRSWSRHHAQPLAKFIKPHENLRSPDRPLRIGYVSPDFRNHVAARHFWPLLRHHDRRQFHISLYAQLKKTDAMSEQLRAAADQWCPIASVTDEQAAERIRQDGIDILIDLALHTAHNRLLIFARKPAPVQVTFMGYPGTTGLDTMDYRLTDPSFDPPGIDDRWYSEESYRLPHTLACYEPPNNELPPVAPLPALENGFVTFGSLNNACKVNDRVLELWACVLRAVARARLLLFAHEGPYRQRTLAFLAQHAVAAERVKFCAHKPLPEYLALYHRIDIGLDTFPYNGHTTSLDSFWMGVPVVTLVGQTAVGRAGLSQSTNLGLEALAARTPEEFVGRAVALAGDLPRLQALRAGLRARMKQSPLMDAAAYTRAVENAYRNMWGRWCARP